MSFQSPRAGALSCRNISARGSSKTLEPSQRERPCLVEPFLVAKQTGTFV